MRIEGDIYFNPNTKWSKINTDQIDDLINQYHERIKGYYLFPVHQLFSNCDHIHCNGFAAGVLLLSAIDAVGTFQTKRNGFKNKFIEFIKNDDVFINLEEPEKKRISEFMSDEFRNGLIHNGRIKNACEFSFESQNLFYLTERTLVVNPIELFQCVQRNSSKFFDELKTDEAGKKLFRDEFVRLYRKELKDFK
jgi:hypothetical protein